MSEILHIDVLDKGYVMMRNSWVLGDGDIEIVNDARVSFNKSVEALRPADLRLIDFLGREEHTSPFRGSVAKVEVYAPLMVARQWWKYIIGSQFDERKMQDPFTSMNESSRRYLTENVEFYIPNKNEWRSAPENKKQGSGACVDEDLGSCFTQLLEAHCKRSNELYERAMKFGICAEQARLFLPAYALYVRFRWTASLQTLAHFIHQRVMHDAQKEIQSYGIALYELTSNIWVHGLKALLTEEEIAACVHKN